MRRTALILGAMTVALGACVSSPKQTVLSLDTTDPKWTSKRCVAARKAVARYDDGERQRGVIGLVGNIAAPFAGTAASLALSRTKDRERAVLNHEVRAACISDPASRRHAASKSRRVASR